MRPVVRNDNVIERLQRQLIDPEVADYIRKAREFGHSLSIVLYVRTDGSTSNPRLNIETRPDKGSKS